MSTRPFHVVVWGATGFTGRLVCEQLTKEYQGRVRWAMAGRSKAKLEVVRSEMAVFNPAANDVPVLVADISDQASLNNMAAQASVLITTVGPYARHGRPVVSACVESGTHYCDLTAEGQFIMRTIDEFHEAAKGKGVKIVHSCGFDSVPSEVGALMTAHHLKSMHGVSVATSESMLVKLEGGVSGGTIESGLNMMKEAADVRKKMRHPYAYDPAKRDLPLDSLPDKGLTMAPMWLKGARTWSGPFVMAVANEPLVRRSNALLNYGSRMSFVERTKTKSWIGALGTSFLMASLGLVIGIASKLQFVRKLLPMPSQGPSRETMEGGCFVFRNVSTGEVSAEKEGVRVQATFKDMHRDGGYLSTSRMILECALCMALQSDDLDSDPYAGKWLGGVLTPSSACGLVLVERLKNAGYEADVVDLPSADTGSSKRDT